MFNLFFTNFGLNLWYLHALTIILHSTGLRPPKPESHSVLSSEYVLFYLAQRYQPSLGKTFPSEYPHAKLVFSESSHLKQSKFVLQKLAI